MSRGARLAVLAVGMALVVAVATGRAGLLVRPWFAPVLLVAGGLVVLAALRRPVDLSRGGALLLMAPVVVGLTLTPAVVGGVSGGPADPGTLTSRIGDPANPLLAGRGGQVTLLQILLAEQSVGSVVLSGRPVTVEALVTGPHTLSRSVIVCCAADAQAVSLPESGTSLPATKTWVRVSGRLGSSGGQSVLTATSVTRIPTPANPFL